MKTTVTLEPDVEELIRDAMREKSISFQEALNQVVRLGLGAGANANVGRFVQPTFRMGALGEAYPLDKALALVDTLDQQELDRNLLLRK